MDWSSVFEDEGEEDGNWVREEISSRTRILNIFGKDGYTPLVCYAFTVNYILGVGCLGIPFAFLQCGIVLGSVLVVVLSVVSFVTVIWVASATQQEITIAAYHLTKSTNPFVMSPFSSQVRRNHQLRNSSKARHAAQKPTDRTADSSTEIVQGPSNILMLSLKSVISSTTMESFGLLSSAVTPVHHSTTVQPGGKISYSSLSPIEVGHHHHTLGEEWHFASLPSSTRLTNHNHMKLQKSSSRTTSLDNLSLHQQQQQQRASIVEQMTVQELEVTDLVEEFLGGTGKMIYQFALLALTYVGLLAYTQVFNETFRLQVWPSVPRWLPPILFGVMVVPLSCFDLQEQIAVQVTMSLLRFFSLGILMIGTLVALCVDYQNSALAETTSISNYHIPMMNWNGFGVMFTTAIFSQLFQHSVPGLIRPLSKENKKFIPTIFKAALISTALLYIATGTICVLYFGNNLNQSVNLNFVGFAWGVTVPANPSAMNLAHYWSVKALAMIVVLFPALDTLSVFPLIAITLGNNLNAAFPHIHFFTSNSDSLHSHQNQPHDSESNHWTPTQRKRIMWRLIAAIPPILCSLSIRHLVISLQIAGLCGILVALVFPALLHQHAQVRAEMLPLSWAVYSFEVSWCGSCQKLWQCWSAMFGVIPSPMSPHSNGSSGGSDSSDNHMQGIERESNCLQKQETTVSVMGILLIAAAALCVSLYQMTSES